MHLISFRVLEIEYEKIVILFVFNIIKKLFNLVDLSNNIHIPKEYRFKHS